MENYPRTGSQAKLRRLGLERTMFGVSAYVLASQSNSPG